MKIFNRSSDDQKPAPTGPAGAAAAPLPPGPTPPVPPAPETAPAGEGAAPATPDITAVLDANVKEMSEKIARLTSSLEGTQQEKADFEAKLEMMEERMRKLSSLTEMISAQYNPFIGAAPEERGEPPAPDVGLAAPPVTSAPAAAAVAPLVRHEKADEIPMGAPSLGGLGLEPFPPEPAIADAPLPSGFPPLEEESATPFGEVSGVHVFAIRPCFESSLLMLSWADMLLRSLPSRDSLVETVNYYVNIGWLGEPARDQLLAYANGIAAPEIHETEKDWRATMEVHEKSLLFVEKLRAIAQRGGA